MPPKMLISPMVTVWIAVIFGVLAYYLDFWRLFAYGLLFAISEVLSGLFGGYIGAMAQTISGIAVLLIGPDPTLAHDYKLTIHKCLKERHRRIRPTHRNMRDSA